MNLRARLNETVASMLLPLVAVAVCVGGCGKAPPASESRATPGAVDAQPPGPESAAAGPAASLLVEATELIDASRPRERWPDGVYLTPEITPGGVALFDYDGDGDLDIYQVRHGVPAEMPDAFQTPAPNRLYRQGADGRFTEVPKAAGLADAGYGHGCAVGDIDNDGDLDVFVTNYGPNRLYRNQDGAFADVTAGAGIGGDRWSSAAAFFDYDRDGWLDLFVVNFGVFDPTRRCGAAADPNFVDYCGPHLFDGVTDQLYRNNGDGTFTDVTAEARITSPSRGWGVLCVDLTGDDWPDIYVCNDEEPNQLWVNDGAGGFVDDAMFLGCALNGDGRVEASMGVAVGDVNGDGRQDLFMTHVASETNTLYTRGEGDAYDDASAASGASAVDLPFTGWGCALMDLDHDRDLDMVVANGRVAVGPVLPAANLGPYWDRYAEPNLLLLNDGRGRFDNVSSDAGAFGELPDLARGMAVGDLDRDGDLDLVTNGIDNRLRVYVNHAPAPGAHWVQLSVRDGVRDAVGARVELVAASGSQARHVLPSSSYLASHDPRVHFGLGDDGVVQRVIVTWVDGQAESFEDVEVDVVSLLRRGEGVPLGSTTGD